MERSLDTSTVTILHVSKEVIKNKLLNLEAMKVVTRNGKRFGSQRAEHISWTMNYKILSIGST